jgi:hypothetical protein
MYSLAQSGTLLELVVHSTEPYLLNWRLLLASHVKYENTYERTSWPDDNVAAAADGLAL